MDDELKDRIITGVLGTIAGGSTAVGMPALAPAGIILAVVSLVLAALAPEDILTVIKWILAVILIVVILVLVFFAFAGWMVWHFFF